MVEAVLGGIATAGTPVSTVSHAGLSDALGTNSVGAVVRGSLKATATNMLVLLREALAVTEFILDAHRVASALSAGRVDTLGTPMHMSGAVLPDVGKTNTLEGDLVTTALKDVKVETVVQSSAYAPASASTAAAGTFIVVNAAGKQLNVLLNGSGIYYRALSSFFISIGPSVWGQFGGQLDDYIGNLCRGKNTASIVSQLTPLERSNLTRLLATDTAQLVDQMTKMKPGYGNAQDYSLHAVRGVRKARAIADDIARHIAPNLFIILNNKIMPATVGTIEGMTK